MAEPDVCTWQHMHREFIEEAIKIFSIIPYLFCKV